MKLTVAGFAWPLIAITLPAAAAATYLVLRTFEEIGSDRDGHLEAEATHRRSRHDSFFLSWRCTCS